MTYTQRVLVFGGVYFVLACLGFTAGLGFGLWSLAFTPLWFVVLGLGWYWVETDRFPWEE